MKYVIITAKHHDGFAMYPSSVSRYNIRDATPFKRDPMRELAAAARKHGLRFGFYNRMPSIGNIPMRRAMTGTTTIPQATKVFMADCSGTTNILTCSTKHASMLTRKQFRRSAN
jgi:hypothetical protein